MDVNIAALAAVEHGFKTFEIEARKIVEQQGVFHSKEKALSLLNHNLYQVRACGVFVLGFIACKDATVLPVLKETARSDQSWQVQEIVAKSFDQYCKDIGYEKALPEILSWLKDKDPNVCRAVTEGLRIWTSRPYFKTNPEVAIKLISQHKASDSAYLRKSVGNALRDIGKKHMQLINKEISRWNLENKKIAFTHRCVLKKG
ncbi:DNA alkylation repair enzyme [Sphingobacterium nematocida]|uniref:DNA alkylation repair enzyme n=1 Tax=Sphingobacterium nematocida TaxID=1513896 RepID=A0A1T5AXC9_9SPHI|nr:HEAT repeat domain-containing protein [Sphingobacterium nematocida]SKB39634.1 DNA alkylation repair enzyme [Sphingobacterium nematocida]